MKYDFSKLEVDLIEGNRLAMERAALSDDGGTANLDCCFLILDGAREVKVLETIKRAGLYCRTKSKWIGNGYFITPNTGGQGNKRSLAVETMTKHLKARGWECLTFYKMD
jgi:hypothetical protein